mmetsp:Transcript_9394/g.9199  ORF Transcript_9394/g.9199 Transcript_9394/m.9199 type:complete len:268 (-) Transcript_9394:107-910(-)
MEEAYAKLTGRIGPSNDDETTKREFLITKLPCILGRAILDDGSNSIVVDPDDILLSRQHVEISWTQSSGWSLLCLSKNGCTVNKHKYGKSDTVYLSNGSPIRIGNARFYFTLPVVPPDIPVNDKKRSHSETFAGTDEEEGDLIIGMPGTITPISELVVKNNSSCDSKPHLKLINRGESYLSMIDACFESADLIQGEEKSIHQSALVDWVAKNYYVSLGELQRQSLRKGIYNALSKHFTRIGGKSSLEGATKVKRGTIRWAKALNPLI